MYHEAEEMGPFVCEETWAEYCRLRSTHPEYGTVITEVFLRAWEEQRASAGQHESTGFIGLIGQHESGRNGASIHRSQSAVERFNS